MKQLVQKLVKAGIRVKRGEKTTGDDRRNQLAQAIGLAMLEAGCVAVEVERDYKTNENVISAACWACALHSHYNSDDEEE